MLSITASELNALVAGLIFPLARILGLFTTAPLLGNRAISMRIRLATGVAIAVAVAPMVPAPAVSIDSWQAIWVMGEQAIIGMAAGFMMRIMLAAVDMAAEAISMQMGLSFAVSFNPVQGGQTTIVADFLGLMVLMMLLAMDGHLMFIKVIVASFEWLPIGQWSTNLFMGIVQGAAVIFSMGIMMALPVIAALLLTNISLGILTRAAPQLNLFSIGFPITIAVGFVALLASLGYMSPIAQSLFELGFDQMELLLRSDVAPDQAARGQG